MAIYNYIALKNNKDIVKGKVEAADLREARASIKNLLTDFSLSDMIEIV